MKYLAPSMLSADFLHLEKDVLLVNEHADMFHLDVMDGVFVPNISYGFPLVKAIAKKAQKPLDVHLMIVEPEKYAGKFALEGAELVSFHLNATKDPAQVVKIIRDNGAKAGIAINPDIPVSELFPWLDKCDFVLLMSVYAGFGGQKFIGSTTARLQELLDEIQRRNLDILVEVDGGINPENAALVAQADILVAGSSVFGAKDPVESIAKIRSSTGWRETLGQAESWFR